MARKIGGKLSPMAPEKKWREYRADMTVIWFWFDPKKKWRGLTLIVDQKGREIEPDEMIRTKRWEIGLMVEKKGREKKSYLKKELSGD